MYADFENGQEIEKMSKQGAQQQATSGLNDSWLIDLEKGSVRKQEWTRTYEESAKMKDIFKEKWDDRHGK